MSAEPERVFSAAKITLSQRRGAPARRRPASVIVMSSASQQSQSDEICQSSQNYRDGLISASHAEITELKDMLNALYIQQLDGGEA
ncbi:hypothetical protein FN846DRAFT_906517 [Sphaerosporella brunnea]|uniref:Uncharacterized protein n=1 Tax=Sphaerosporella brunnea TaxID=1250544 RepID=A0A5J5EYK9_9PEZI|nr:hypothetical protein FN846DRAFT_906517 [Sphaerosporella brunnea]